MRTLITMMVCLFGASTAHAQYYYNPWWGYNLGVGTAQSAYLNGRGELLRGEAARLRALGLYRERNQRAYKQWLENNKQRIQDRWEIIDKYRQRVADRNPTYLDRLEKRMSTAERRYSLKQKEADLIEKGVLPPKKKSYFAHKGEKYNSYKDFKASPEYAAMIAERDTYLANEKAKREEKERRYQEALIPRTLRELTPFTPSKVNLIDRKLFRVRVLGESTPFSEWPEHHKKAFREYMKNK